MSSDALNPEPVTELPLTPPAEDDEEEAAIEKLSKQQITMTPTGTVSHRKLHSYYTTE